MALDEPSKDLRDMLVTLVQSVGGISEKMEFLDGRLYRLEATSTSTPTPTRVGADDSRASTPALASSDDDELTRLDPDAAVGGGGNEGGNELVVNSDPSNGTHHHHDSIMLKNNNNNNTPYDDLDVVLASVVENLSYEDGADLLTQLQRAKQSVELLRTRLIEEHEQVIVLTQTLLEERSLSKKLRGLVSKERSIKQEYLGELQAYRQGKTPSSSAASASNNIKPSHPLNGHNNNSNGDLRGR
jgi:hypothetical protein